MTKRLIDYQERLLKKLTDEEFAAEYLNQALKEEDPRMFLLALKNVVAAQGEDISTLAKETNVARMSIYRMLSIKGNPKFTNLISLLSSAGFEVEIRPKHK